MKKIFSTSFKPSLLQFWLLLLRVSVSGFMLTHGFPKLLKVVNGDLQFGDPYGIGAEISLFLAAFAEGICSIFVLLGLGTRLAVIPLIFTMVTIVFVVHINDPFGRQELPLLYLLIYITLLITGAGKYSIDQVIKK